LVLQLADLRSAIVRCACEVLRDLVVAHGRALAPLVAHSLQQLLTNLALLKVFSSVSATTAAVAVGLAPSSAALKVLIGRSRDPKKQVRQGSLELLQILFADRKFDISPKGLVAALGALGSSTPAGRGVTDPDGGVRQAAAKAYWAAAAGYPGSHVNGFLESLSPKERKLVERLKPSTQTEG
jgi:hypothetical protein